MRGSLGLSGVGGVGICLGGSRGVGGGEGLGDVLGFGVWCLGLARLGWIRGWVSGLEKLRFFY